MTAQRRSPVVPVVRSLVVCLSVFCANVLGQSAPSQVQDLASHRNPTLDVASLAAEVRSLQAQIEDGRALSSLPAEWVVATPDGRYPISTEPLRELLHGGGAAPSKEELKKATLWLEGIAQHLEGFSKGSQGSASNARPRLDSILARPEFGRSSRSSAIEELRKKLAAWIADLMRRILGGLAQNPTGEKVLFWVVAAVGLTILMLWLLRLWRSNRNTVGLQVPQPPATPQSWERWIEDARRAADQGDAREAIRCAYWAAVVRLQETEVLARDLNQTPREYLRSISEPCLASSVRHSSSVKPLAALTFGLESSWYAGRPASLDDFRESLHHLEALGCKLD